MFKNFQEFAKIEIGFYYETLELTNGEDSNERRWTYFEACFDDYHFDAPSFPQEQAAEILATGKLNFSQIEDDIRDEHYTLRQAIVKQVKELVIEEMKKLGHLTESEEA